MVVVPSRWSLLRILRVRHWCIPAQHREHRRSNGDQDNPRSSRAGRGCDAGVQTRRPCTAATETTGPNATRLTADLSLTQGREAGLTPGSVSLTPGGPDARHFSAGNGLDGAPASWSSEIQGINGPKGIWDTH